MDKSDDPTYNDDKYKSWLNWCLENARGSINYDKPHRVKWTSTIPGGGSEYANFPNYEQACKYVRDNLNKKEPGSMFDNDHLLFYIFKWKITDLHSWEVRNHDDYRNNTNDYRNNRNDDDDDFYDDFYEEDEYELEYHYAILKVCNSKAFINGLGRKLAMRTC